MIQGLRLVLGVVMLLATAAAQFTYDMVSYHGVSHASHQASFNNLEPQGYRLISLAVGGGWANAHYSAVWLRQNGPAWVSAHGMTESQYTTQRTAWLLQGYRAKIVTASGSGTDKVYAAVYVQDGVAASSQINLSLSAFETDAATRRENGYRLVCCATYGTTASPLFAPVYEPATEVGWGWEANDTATEFSDHVGAHADGECRPAFFAMTDNQRYFSIWHDDRVGGWAWVGNRTSAQFTADKTAMANAGLVPLCIAGGGSGTSARFSAVFVERLAPYTRTLTHSGAASIPLTAFDQMMDQFVVANRVRAASIAVVRDGRLVHTRGYTYAEPGYPATTPTSLFRIGSISKALCGMVAHDCIEHGIGGLTLSTNLVNRLGITSYGTGVGSITLQQLMTHSSGFVNVVNEIDAATWWAQGTPLVMPPDESAIVRYASLVNATTAGQWKYSNAGNTAIGQIVETVTGQGYMTALGSRLLTPLGVTRFGRMQGPRNLLLAGEVHYHLANPYLRAGNLYADGRLMAPQYCQRFWDSAGGVVTSAVDLARVIAGSFQIGADSPVFSVARQNAILNRQSYPVYGDPGSTQGWTDGAWGWKEHAPGEYTYWHDGAQDGFRSFAMFRSDGIGVVVLFNTDSRVNLDEIQTAIGQVTSWPTGDAFPTYGLPTFPRTPQFSGFHTASLGNVTKQAFTFSGTNLDQVTSVTFGSHVLTPALSTAWENGYLELVSPTSLRVHAPQGLDPGVYGVRASSAQGAGNLVNVTVTASATFACEVQDYVFGGAMPFSVIASRGPLSNLSWVALTFSQSNLPSVAPGIVSLGLGASFTDFFATDLQPFSPVARTARWDFPGLGGYQDTWFQCAAIDFLAPLQFPLATTPVVMLNRN